MLNRFFYFVTWHFWEAGGISPLRVRLSSVFLGALTVPIFWFWRQEIRTIP